MFSEHSTSKPVFLFADEGCFQQRYQDFFYIHIIYLMFSFLFFFIKKQQILTNKQMTLKLFNDLKSSS